MAHIHPFNGPFSGTTQVSRYKKGKTNLDFTEAKDSEWQWHQLEHMQVCTSLQTDNHASTPPLSFLQARCPSCHPTNSVKALKHRFIWHLVITPEVFAAGHSKLILPKNEEKRSLQLRFKSRKSVIRETSWVESSRQLEPSSRKRLTPALAV